MAVDLDELERLEREANDVSGKGFAQNAESYVAYDEALHEAAPALFAEVRRAREEMGLLYKSIAGSHRIIAALCLRNAGGFVRITQDELESIPPDASLRSTDEPRAMVIECTWPSHDGGTAAVRFGGG